MIKKKDVVIMRIPFPNIESQLARDAHMYICLENHPKKFLKCQSSYKHLKDVKSPPYNFIEEIPDIRHNPFGRVTLIDCDKSFLMSHDISLTEDLLHRKRRDISEELFGKLEYAIKHDKFKEVVLDAKIVVELNVGIELV